jgi:hypothetical protein
VDSRRSFATVAGAIVALSVIASFAQGQNSPTPDRSATDDRGYSSPLCSEAAADQPPCPDCDAIFGRPCRSARWTASADLIALERVGSFHQTLVETVPGTVPFNDLSKTPGTERLNATDLRQDFSAGPRFGLTGHGDDGYDWELSYFQIDGWDAYRGVGPTPDDWLVMRAPGGFLQTQDDKETQMMVWDYASRLYNAECNLRWTHCARITLLAGFRWVSLREELQGTLPPQRSVPFWDTTTRNDLYGFQVGADGKLLERGRFSIDGVAKAGVFDNEARETTGVSIYRTVYWESASTSHAAFLGELALQCKYRVTPRLSLKLAYDVMWLEGVAAAPGQIPETLSHVTPPVSVQAIGVDSHCGVFYHGATAGLEYAF